MTGRVLVAPISFGLGDLVVSLPVIGALVAEGAPVWLVARSPSQRALAARIPGLAGVVADDGVNCEAGDRLVDLRDHPLQLDYWWGSPAFEEAFGDMSINNILALICADFGIAADFSAPAPLLANPCPQLGRTVLFVHESDGAHKRWAPDQWVAAAAQLRADGHDVAAVTRGEAPSPFDEWGVPVLILATLDEAVDALGACHGVIGVDTGLTHIAAQQSTPTVTICRRSSVYFRPWRHCAVLRGERCTDECIAVEERYAYNHEVSLRGLRLPSRSCPSDSACLRATGPDQAVALLRALL